VTPVTSSSFTATVASESFNDARIVFYDLEYSWVTILGSSKGPGQEKLQKL
jgi:hypothetical protein